MEHTHTHPSKLGAFFKGLATGALSGALMVGIIAGLSFFAFGGGFMPPSAAAMLTAASAIFSGIMNVKNVIFDTPQASAPRMARTRQQDIPVMVPVIGQGIAAAAPSVAPETETAAPALKWTEKTGREAAQTRIDMILQNGSLGDKDRASAILAARDSAPAEANRA